MLTKRSLLTVLFAGLLLGAAGCADAGLDGGEPPLAEPPRVEPEPEHRVVDSRPPPLAEPVDFYVDGAADSQIEAATAREDGYVLLELGEDWTPYLFTVGTDEAGEPLPNAYRETYLALARGEYPDDHHGQRARRDKYLELFGIPPTLGLLRERFRAISALECTEELDLTALEEFDGFVAYRNNDSARAFARTFAVLNRQVERLVASEGVADESELAREQLEGRDWANVRDYREKAPEAAAIRATQARLACEGFFEGKGNYTRGGLDWVTHEALAEFERRNRVYGWGFIGRDTLDALRRSPLENEREAVIRVLTERAMHAAGVIEDGSTSMNGEDERTYESLDGSQVPIRNLEMEIRDQLVASLGLSTTESTRDFLEGLGELAPGRSKLVAFEAPALPEYYDADMDLTVELDRGDLWYEFPYDEEGQERSQPVNGRPRLTIYTQHNGARIPLARFGSTIGGWRSDNVDGELMWKYKNSPVGERVWRQIVASPVWLPPESTPPNSLLSRAGNGRYQVNYHEMGPSYASAYGLVAAYHLRFNEEDDGSLRYLGDEGIRVHGSVDYMSIMRRHSHGCHRLHNHIAVRLMSFVLAHRRHRVAGQQQIAFGRTLVRDGQNYPFELTQGGYVFRLEEPVRINILSGRVLGSVSSPIDHPLPRWNEEVGAYVMPDGATVAVSRAGVITPVEIVPEEGVLIEGEGGDVADLTDEQLLQVLPLPAAPAPAAPAPAPLVPAGAE